MDTARMHYADIELFAGQMFLLILSAPNRPLRAGFLSEGGVNLFIRHDYADMFHNTAVSTFITVTKCVLLEEAPQYVAPLLLFYKNHKIFIR